MEHVTLAASGDTSPLSRHPWIIPSPPVSSLSSCGSLRPHVHLPRQKGLFSLPPTTSSPPQTPTLKLGSFKPRATSSVHQAKTLATTILSTPLPAQISPTPGEPRFFKPGIALPMRSPGTSAASVLSTSSCVNFLYSETEILQAGRCVVSLGPQLPHPLPLPRADSSHSETGILQAEHCVANVFAWDPAAPTPSTSTPMQTPPTPKSRFFRSGVAFSKRQVRTALPKV